MYKNIGEKIKKDAKFMCWLGIIASVIVAVILLYYGNFFDKLTYGSKISDHEETLNWIGFAVLVFGPILSWVDGAFWYGFGVLIQTNKKSCDYLKALKNMNYISPASDNNSKKETVTDTSSHSNEKHTDTIVTASTPTIEKPLKSLLPQRVTINENGEIVCPVCKTVQRSNRSFCYNCESVFINGQPGIPYWCAKCGEKGPFENGVCSKCGSDEKIINEKAKKVEG